MDNPYQLSDNLIAIIEEINKERAMDNSSQISPALAAIIARVEAGRVFLEALEHDTLTFYLRKIEHVENTWVRTYAVHAQDLSVTELVAYIVNGITNSTLISVEVQKPERGGPIMRTVNTIEDIMNALDSMCDMPEGNHIRYMVIK